ncbi:MAG: CBS domain-containing protein [Candidatus Latescibacterota bacterium]
MLRTIMEAMHRGVVTCGVAAPVDEVIRIMLDNHVHALVVIDERLDACGVVTKTDLLKCYGKHFSSITAEDIMNPTLLTVSPDTLVHEAVQQMLTHKVHQLVIVTEAKVHHRPVGIFTIADAVALMAGESGPRS